jgi:hypothetical protein
VAPFAVRWAQRRHDGEAERALIEQTLIVEPSGTPCVPSDQQH